MVNRFPKFAFNFNLRPSTAARNGASVRSLAPGTAGRRRKCVQVRAVQTPVKPANPGSSTRTSTDISTFPKSEVESRKPHNIAPASETFKDRYADYSTGYASVPGLSYERSEWITEVIGEIPAEMEGTLLRNGPAMYVRGDFTKSYLDGDGMVTSIAIKAGPHPHTTSRCTST